VYKNNNILITGGYGFLGSYLYDELKKRGYEYINRFHSSEFDLTVKEDVLKMYIKYSPGTVIHLAAVVGGIGENRKNPGKFIYDNLMMGTHLIHEGRNIYDKFVMVGTVCSYPKHCPTPFKEYDIWNGYPEETNAPYGIAKKTLVQMLQSYNTQYAVKGISIIPTNLYGINNRDDTHVIPQMINRFVEAIRADAPKITLWGSGNVFREFLHVKDAAVGIIIGMEEGESGDILNIGSGDRYSIKELAALIAEYTGYKGEIVWDASQPDGQPDRLVDITRISNLGFKKQENFEESLKELVQWRKLK